MATYQRYQTLCSAEQHLFSPSCPVWVQKYQLSWDVQTGSRLLQCRMVNVAEKAVTAVYLRVLCRDEQGRDLTTMHLVPVTGLFVSPGELFGDDKVVALWPKRTAFAEIFAERVCFSDGTAWNEPPIPDYEAIPAPAPVRPADAAYAKLAPAAREGGVRNDFYFRDMNRVWQCTCGLPNSSTVLRCRHCGADRLWLQQHMDAEKLLAPPAPKPAPAPEPEPEPVLPVEHFKLTDDFAAVPMPVLAEEEFPMIRPAAAPTETPMPEAAPAQTPQPKKRHGGRIAAIVLAILLFLGIGGWLAWRQFLSPYLRYQEAAASQEDGDYERALALFRDLGDYQDSASRADACEAKLAYQEAAALYNNGEYAKAYERFCKMEGHEDDAAACLYTPAVLASNAQDYEAAWSYVRQLEAQYPLFKADEVQKLQVRCCYGFGAAAMQKGEEADSVQDMLTYYSEAQDWFRDAGDYRDSAAQIRECDYRVAQLTLQEAAGYGDSAMLLQAVEAFTALGDYSDSRQMRLVAMYEYCAREDDPQNETTVAFLKELLDAGYEDAEQLYDHLFPMTVSIDLWINAANGSRSAVEDTLPLEQMERLWVSYSIEGGRDENVYQIRLIYTLPDGTGGSATVNPGNTRDDALPLYDVLPVKAKEAGKLTLQFCNGKNGATIKTVEIELTKNET